MSQDSNENKEAQMTGHSYDGIEELDNPLPMWWLATFFATIIFAFLYYTHYEIANAGKSLAQEFQIEKEILEEAGHAVHNSINVEPEEELEEMMAVSGSVQSGAQLFLEKCSACHGKSGEGIIGPNLTDRFWIHGKGLRGDILTVIRAGVLEKGMPAWQASMSGPELIQVAAYVYSLKDSKPANGKAAQGVEVQ